MIISNFYNVFYIKQVLYLSNMMSVIFDIKIKYIYVRFPEDTEIKTLYGIDMTKFI